MAIDIKFDLVGNPEPPTIILANRNGNILGQLDVDEDSIDLCGKFVDASEFSFTLNKYVDDKITNLWDKVVDFKLVYCKEWDCWFEIKVELDEETETVKTVFCTQLGQAELSQIMLYGVEINTEEDIARDDYKISILYDENDPRASILNRMLDKAPHYRIAYVDPTIRKIQRSFSFDGTSICDGFQEVAEEIGCLFQYPSNSIDGKIQRDIFVYDLQQNCKDCGHRGEFTHKCPECGSTNIKYGYGEDTLIFVTSDELASGGIQLVTDTDSVKNCFKLEAGDDLMTATVRNCNPNGTDYIWYFSDSLKEDMSDELVERLESYDRDYQYYNTEHVSNINEELLNKYNALVDKYIENNESLEKISNPVKGYASLMNAYYNTVDLALYLKSGLMPTYKNGFNNTTVNTYLTDETDTRLKDEQDNFLLYEKIESSNNGSVGEDGTDVKISAEQQASLLTSDALSPVSVADITIASLPTINNTVLAMAKIIVKSTYKVQVNTSELSEDGETKLWTGNFTITNYSDEEDVAISEVVSIVVNDDYENFVKQKMERLLGKENTDDVSITGLFEKEYDDFCEQLKLYSLTPLLGFRDACQACIDILIEQGVGNGETWGETDEGAENNLYENLYAPYYNKLLAIESEIKIRESEIGCIVGVYDVDGLLVSEGVQNSIDRCRAEIQNALNFENYLGKELWMEFCAYRREDKYQNENYISDGLNNAELFQRALEFFEVAENEIYKSAELQTSISTTLNNLLAIPRFKHLVKSFKLGNWIRVQIDNRIYKLRLVEYEIDFGDFNNISVKFSDTTKVKNGTTDVQDIFAKASSMATSYSSIQRQASQGNSAKQTLEQWVSDGLSAATVQIDGADSGLTITRNGLLGCSHDDITGEEFPEQLKLTHNIIAYTDDGWKTVRQAIGKHDYMSYDEDSNKFVKKTGYGMSSNFVSSGTISGSQIIGGDIYSDNYSKTEATGSYLNLRDGTFSFGGGSLRFENGKLIISSKEADTNIVEVNEEWLKETSVCAQKLQVNVENLVGETIKDKNISGGSLLIGDKDSTYTEITSDGVLSCKGANISIGALLVGDKDSTYTEIASDGTFNCNGVNISGGTMLIGDKDATHTKITSDGVLTCKGAKIFGAVTTDNLSATGGLIGGWTLAKNVSFYMPDFSQSYTGAAFTYSWKPEEGCTYTAYFTPVGVYATKVNDSTQEASSKFSSWWNSLE